MNVDQVLQSLKTEFPNKAIDLAEGLDLLKEVINDTMIAINHKSNDAFNVRNFDERKQYDEMAQFIYVYEQKIENVIHLLDVDVTNLVIDSDTDEELEKKKIPNYADYLVDNNVEHTLKEDFTHKRPSAFRIKEDNIIEVKTWKEMMIKTAEFLLTIDSDKFLEFENISGMNGKKNKYFSASERGMNQPRLAGNKIYIETTMSGNSIRNLIVKMIKAYGFNTGDYKVYFRADYSELNQD